MSTGETHKKRMIWLDSLRGLTIISMVFYHALWDLVFIYHEQIGWYKSTIGYIWQQSICMTFIIISGFCFHLDKHPVKRGLLISFWGIVITLVTAIAEPSAIIIFGILTFYGAAIIIVTIINPIIIKIPSILGFAISILLFVVTRDVPYRYLGYESLKFMRLPDFLYSNYFTTFWGFMHEGFYSSDYFSIIPWIFLFIAGYYFYKIWEKSNLKSIDLTKGNFLSKLGEHSLLIYILHQPIISLAFMIIYKFQ